MPFFVASVDVNAILVKQKLCDLSMSLDVATTSKICFEERIDASLAPWFDRCSTVEECLHSLQMAPSASVHQRCLSICRVCRVNVSAIRDELGGHVLKTKKDCKMETISTLSDVKVKRLRSLVVGDLKIGGNLTRMREKFEQLRLYDLV